MYNDLALLHQIDLIVSDFERVMSIIFTKAFRHIKLRFAF